MGPISEKSVFNIVLNLRRVKHYWLCLLETQVLFDLVLPLGSMTVINHWNTFERPLGSCKHYEYLIIVRWIQTNLVLKNHTLRCIGFELSLGDKKNNIKKPINVLDIYWLKKKCLNNHTSIFMYFHITAVSYLWLFIMLTLFTKCSVFFFFSLIRLRNHQFCAI